MIINVAKKDIDKGEISAQDTCMVSLAVLRALLKKKKTTLVKTNYSNIIIGGIPYKVSVALKDKISRFDCRLFVKPFKIKLDEKTKRASVV